MVEALLLTVLLCGVLERCTLLVLLELLLLTALLLLGFLDVVEVRCTVRLGVWVTSRFVTEVLLGVRDTVRFVTDLPLVERTASLLLFTLFCLNVLPFVATLLSPLLLETPVLERVLVRR